MAQLNIRIDDNLKEQGEELFNSLGLTFSTAISAFVSQSIREGGLPFTLTMNVDPFYSTANIERLRNAIADAKAGRNMTEHELIEVADD